MNRSKYAEFLSSLKFRKGVLLTAIVATTLLPLIFVELDEQTASLEIFKFLAKIGSLSGTVLIFWQFILGFRKAGGRIVTDFLWTVEVHKFIGKSILFLIILHPLFITLYYLEKMSFNPLLLEGGSPFRWWALAGEAAFAIFLAIVLTSVFWRTRLGRARWYGVHLTSYAALAIVLAHSFAIGQTVRTTGAFYYWLVLAAVAVAFAIFRLMCRAGMLSKKHRVVQAQKVAPDVTRISCIPLTNKLKPRLGQYVYFRKGLSGRIRPFTVSHYDHETGEVSITVKAMGKTTNRLQSIQPGEIVYIDGPYGVFSQAALKTDHPLVMIAGGIGITPFTRLFQELAYEPGRELHLFYGNKKKHEIVYKDQFENVESINVIHVISNDPDYPGETGYITTDLLKKHLHQPLTNYEFLICGPPVMTAKLESALLEQGVPPVQIHHEMFTY